MNAMISVFVGCITFLLMYVIKIPIKKFIACIVCRFADDEERQYYLCKRWNALLFFVTMMVAALCYYYVGGVLKIDHYKWCCSLKAGAIAIAIYAVCEQMVPNKKG